MSPRRGSSLPTGVPGEAKRFERTRALRHAHYEPFVLAPGLSNPATRVEPARRPPHARMPANQGLSATSLNVFAASGKPAPA
jgi:hypothetical protein